PESGWREVAYITPSSFSVKPFRLFLNPPVHCDDIHMTGRWRRIIGSRFEMAREYPYFFSNRSQIIRYAPD
ncbi:hypothetical protein, partial [Sodalis praecaptivus]|uniref:hypothetical protein n=1 Tax=Sodalis praecaptivus TaxID=1239307 RepID=UPI00280AF278